jgi:hypothetical protein
MDYMSILLTNKCGKLVIHECLRVLHVGEGINFASIKYAEQISKMLYNEVFRDNSSVN